MGVECRKPQSQKQPSRLHTDIVTGGPPHTVDVPLSILRSIDLEGAAKTRRRHGQGGLRNEAGESIQEGLNRE